LRVIHIICNKTNLITAIYGLCQDLNHFRKHGHPMKRVASRVVL
jgi:hypothetical protein